MGTTSRVCKCVWGAWQGRAAGGTGCNLNFACMKNAAHLLNARDVLFSVVSAGGEEGKAAYKQNECYSQVTLPYTPLLCPSSLPCLACLFVCLCRAECAAEHALLAALANCCLLSSNATEGVYMCVCVCVCAGVLTLYKLLIIMSPSECRHDLHESFCLAWLSLFMLSPVKGGTRIYYVYISIYICCVCVCVSMAIGKWRCQVTRSLCAGCRRRRRSFRSFIAFVAAGANPPDIFILHMSKAHTYSSTNCH